VRSGRFVCYSVIYAQDYCKKSNQPISLKLGAVVGSTSRKNLLTFSGDRAGAYFLSANRRECCFSVWRVMYGL